MVVRITRWKSHGRRIREKRRKSSIGAIEADLRNMKIRTWINKATYRTEGSNILKQVYLQMVAAPKHEDEDQTKIFL